MNKTERLALFAQYKIVQDEMGAYYILPNAYEYDPDPYILLHDPFLEIKLLNIFFQEEPNLVAHPEGYNDGYAIRGHDNEWYFGMMEAV